MSQSKTPESRPQRIVYTRKHVGSFPISNLLDLDPTTPPETPQKPQLTLESIGQMAISFLKKVTE